jgi:NADP-dependent 3-hydroxy acid dehydrogenase YdfG
MRTVLITGATSGIGKATAYLLAEHGFRLILCGRRKERLQVIESDLKTKIEIRTCCYDVRNRSIVEKTLEGLPETWRNIDVLINNAGNAHGLAPIHEGNIDDWDAMMDSNVKGLLYVSRVILPGMVQRRRGHIINIGSLAAKEVYPSGNVYCASKFAVDAITKGMRIDLNDYNIKVTAIHPGLVETEFSLVRFKGDEQKARDVYKGMKPLTSEDIAEIILFVLTRPTHVNIADLLVLPTAQASVLKINRSVE